jgi:hypothetical protein
LLNPGAALSGGEGAIALQTSDVAATGKLVIATVGGEHVSLSITIEVAESEISSAGPSEVLKGIAATGREHPLTLSALRLYR